MTTLSCQEFTALAAAEARAALAEARVSDDAALIAHLRLEIAKLKRDRFGQRSEHPAPPGPLDQHELQLEELEASATAAAEKAAVRTTTVEAFARRRPSRQPFRAPAARAGGHVRAGGLSVLRKRRSRPTLA